MFGYLVWLRYDSPNNDNVLVKYSVAKEIKRRNSKKMLAKGTQSRNKNKFKHAKNILKKTKSQTLHKM